MAIRTLQIAGAVVIVALVPPQTASLWSPQPGWQVLQDSIGPVDVLAVGLFAEHYFDPSGSFPYPPGSSPRAPVGASRASPRGRVDTANMPRLALRCDNGVTELWLVRPTLNRKDLRLPRTGRQRSASRGAAAEIDSSLVLDFGDDEPIRIDLRSYQHRSEPILLPDPFDTIGRLRRNELLYYFEVEPGNVIAFDVRGGGVQPDAVFRLEGLDELLAARRDPCGWRAS